MALLDNKVALITGSSRGIGRAVALDLAKCGAKVYINYVYSSDKAESLRQEILAFGGKAEIIKADLCDENSTDGIIDKIGGVDILVLNASVQIKEPWEEISKDHFHSQVICNFESSLLLMQQVVPYMRKKKWGRIITIGSVQEAKPHPQMLVYSATKAAQTALVRSLSVQLAPDNITVNNVAPGVIITDRNAEAIKDTEYAAEVMDSIPLRFFGEPEDICGAVRLLCTEEGRYITGQSIYVDGGKGVM